MTTDHVWTVWPDGTNDERIEVARSERGRPRRIWCATLHTRLGPAGCAGEIIDAFADDAWLAAYRAVREALYTPCSCMPCATHADPRALAGPIGIRIAMEGDE